MKKIVQITLAAMLTVSPAAFGIGGINTASANGKNIPALSLQKPSVLVPERLINPSNPHEKVRIIIEMENEPAIVTATERGLLYKDLPKTQRDNLETSITNEHVDVQANLNKVAPGIDYIENFTTIFNGFSAEVDAEFVEKIANTDGVKAVYEATEYQRPSEKPEMVYSKELVQAQKAWKDYGFKGEGMVVGVIDTGIDSSHQDMVLSDNVTGEITEDEVNSLLASDSLEHGKYYTEKVPFGYNYIDDNAEIRDLGPDASMHGMHVSGTVVANGNEENGGIMGVAPEAQVLGLKVFSNNPLFPSTFGDIYVKAIDDSIKLGVDVLNLSLGSTAGYVDANNPEQQAVKRATENGILVSISAGNSDMFGAGSFYPYAENQDYGLTGAPSVADASLGVASFENSTITAYSFGYTVDNVATGRALYLLANNADPTKLEETEYVVLDAGLGKPEDFTGKDFTGKFALISRGGIAFVEKGLNAQAAGAAGVIVYNNAAGTINMASDAAIKIPYMSALRADGLVLKNYIDTGATVKVNFDGNFIAIPNATAGKMSTFTSWGPTPNLDFKPEITAPGGNIFSTLNDNNYGLMSGTSMAAPHVAGGAALIFEKVDKEFGVKNAERVQLAKNLLMNTSKPVELVPGEYVSPRRQGAGLMQLANALSTDVVLTNKATGEAKIPLKEITDNKLTFNLVAKNYSDSEKIYDVDVAVQTDYPVQTSGYDVVAPNIVGSNVVTELVDINAPENVTIPANSEVSLEVSIDVSALTEDALYDVFTNGYFVDGFVTLVDPKEETSGNVPLTIPFFGFNGGWDDAQIFDDYLWDSMTYWGYTALADTEGNFVNGGTFEEGFIPEKFAFSPNGDGSIDKILPVFSLLRNAKKLEVNILDATGKKVRTIRTANNATKHYISSATAAPYTYNTSNSWDGKIDGKTAADGQYQVEVRAVIDYPNAEWQSIEFPILIDTVAPTADVNFDAATKTVSVADFADNETGVGVDRYEIYVNDTEITEKPASETSVKLTNDFAKTDKVTVKIYDIAGNSKVYQYGVNGEEVTGPVIYINSPEYFTFHKTQQIVVEGKVEDDGLVKSVKVNGVEVDEFDGTNYKHTATIEDGFNNVSVEATDEFGNVSQIQHKIFVDTQTPTLTVSGVPETVALTGANPKAKVTVKDNFDEVRIYLNGSEVFFKEISEPYVMNGYETTVEVELPLVIGENKFLLEVTDLVGNKTSKEVKVVKTNDSVVTPPGPVTPPNPGPITPPSDLATVVIGEKEVKDQLSDTTTQKVMVEIPVLTETLTKVKLEFPVAILKTIVDSGKDLAVVSGKLELLIPSTVLKSLPVTLIDKASFTIHASKDHSVPTKGTDLSSVYEFTMAGEKDGKSSIISNFNGKVEVSIPVSKPAKDSRKAAAYFVNEQNKSLDYLGGKLENGVLVFKTNHFSKFVVVENEVTFADVNKHWAQDEIEVLASRTITGGKSDTKFDPQGKITRAEFAVLIARALNLPLNEYKGTFTDVTKSKAWAYAGVEAAYEAGIVKGTSETTFTPDALITREEIATMIVRAVKYQDEHLLKDLDTTKTFADDSSIGSFAKETVKQAAALGIVNGREGNKFDPKANATRAESAVMLYRSLEKLEEL